MSHNKAAGRFVAIKAEGVVQVHAVDSNSRYATLCGMDGDDPTPSVDQKPAKLPRTPYINCDDCKAILRLAWTYTEHDLA